MKRSKKMIKALIGLIILILILYFIIQDYNIQEGSALADTQDELFQNYKSGETSFNLNKLKNNIWISFADFLAPSNLVVRQYVLIDLLSNKMNNEEKIMNQIKVIGMYDSECIWKEGYSYWIYTKPFLEEYALVFGSSNISEFIDCVDEGFLKTAYLKDGVLYPAPFGDLRNMPLETNLQDKVSTSKITIGFVTKDNAFYIIQKAPLGLNTHAPVRESKLQIINGMPYDEEKEFEWYEGYDKKYKNAWNAWWDSIRISRILSLF